MFLATFWHSSKQLSSILRAQRDRPNIQPSLGTVHGLRPADAQKEPEKTVIIETIRIIIITIIKDNDYKNNNNNNNSKKIILNLSSKGFVTTAQK